MMRWLGLLAVMILGAPAAAEEMPLPPSLRAKLADEIEHYGPLQGATLATATSLGNDDCGTFWWVLDVEVPADADILPRRERIHAASVGADRWDVVLADVVGDFERVLPDGLHVGRHVEMREVVRRLDSAHCGLVVTMDETPLPRAYGFSKRTLKVMHVVATHLVYWLKITGVCEVGHCVEVDVTFDGAGHVPFAKKVGDPKLLRIKPGRRLVLDPKGAQGMGY
jgi:hypothetical protein